MQINQISKCCEPKKDMVFGGLKSPSNNKKVRYKHYYEMSNEDLKTYSIAKAYNTVSKGKKMNLKQALPAIAAVAVGTGVAMTQPGKLSTRVSKGLGLLAQFAAIDGAYLLSTKVANKVAEEDQSNQSNVNKRLKSSLAGLGVFVAGVAGIFGIAKAIEKKGIVPETSKLGKFVKSETTKLADEINSSKLGKFVENKLNAFTAKYPKLNDFIGGGLIFGTLVGTPLVDAKLTKSISKDVNNLAVDNFIKGRSAQMDARAHFDSIDAVEV